ncbi:MAG: FAD-binding protein, partial [Gordonibacter sp.]|uniref:FAD-binding protein n=1 Tax=Gordonibacter sp. TaxID=1968902 RepID=UPI002FC6B7E3
MKASKSGATPDTEQSALSRRSFLTGAAATAGLAAFAGLAGCAPQNAADAKADAVSDASGKAPAGAMQTTDPAQAVWPVVEEVEVGAAGEGTISFVAKPIDPKDIVTTHDVDVVVCGLGPSGDAAALSCAEQGLKTVAVEKQTVGNYNSATIGGTNSKLHQHWGMTFDTDAWMSDAMVDCAFQGDMELYRHWLESNGEAVDWYVSHFDNQNLDDYPLTFAAGDFPDFREQWDKTSLSRSWNTSLNLPYPPGELAKILAGILEKAGVEIRYSCPAC